MAHTSYRQPVMFLQRIRLQFCYPPQDMIYLCLVKFNLIFKSLPFVTLMK